MSAIVRFEELPADGRKKYDWAAIGAALKKRPQRWAVVMVCETQPLAGTHAKNVRRGVPSALRPLGIFEAVSRTIDGEHRVYARWVGEPS